MEATKKQYLRSCTGYHETTFTYSEAPGVPDQGRGGIDVRTITVALKSPRITTMLHASATRYYH